MNLNMYKKGERERVTKRKMHQNRTTEAIRTVRKLKTWDVLERAACKSIFQQMIEHNEGNITYETE